MREIGILPKDADTKALSDHLLALGITTRLLEQPEGWAVWVHNEDLVPQARQELEAFKQAPDDPRYHDAARKAEAVRREAERAERAYRKNFVVMSERWSVPGLKGLPLTFGLIVVSIAVGIATELGKSRSPLFRALLLTTFGVDENGAVETLGLSAVRHGEVWRLVTPIFLHFGVLHLLFNMWWLRDLGGMIEARRGTARVAVLVFVSAVVSNLAQYYFEGTPIFGGMSGINYALFGYIWMKSQYQPEQGLWLHPSTVVFMLVWFLFCLTGGVGHVANTVHGAGLVMGIVFGLARF